MKTSGQKPKIVLFDLGNTLVEYFERSEFPGILEQAITEVRNYLHQEGVLRVSPEAMWQRVQEENHESQDHHVRPLESRLARIFALDESAPFDELLTATCRRFLAPIFARGWCYPDALPTLDELRAKGLATAIISNTPWGSPAALWREEIERLGLSERVDAAVFCDDVGWRKPARQTLSSPCKSCAFVRSSASLWVTNQGGTWRGQGRLASTRSSSIAAERCNTGANNRSTTWASYGPCYAPELEDR